MKNEKLVAVRVLAGRSLSLPSENGTNQHVAGDDLELPVDDAARLLADGFVEKRVSSG